MLFAMYCGTERSTCTGFIYVVQLLRKCCYILLLLLYIIIIIIIIQYKYTNY